MYFVNSELRLNSQPPINRTVFS